MRNDSGKIGEDYAANLLREKGYEILVRNYHSRYGEVDIIAQNSRFLVFIEVKTREERSMVGPLEAVTASKRRKVCKTALVYLQSHPVSLQPRFDVIGLTTRRGSFEVISAEHIENAFYPEGFV